MNPIQPWKHRVNLLVPASAATDQEFWQESSWWRRVNDQLSGSEFCNVTPGKYNLELPQDPFLLLSAPLRQQILILRGRPFLFWHDCQCQRLCGNSRGSVRPHRSLFGRMTSLANSSGLALVRGIWAAVIISALIVVLRIFAKIKIKRFFVDDVLMIIAQVQGMTLCSFGMRNPLTCIGVNHRINRLPNPICQPWLRWRSHKAASSGLRTDSEGHCDSSSPRYIQHDHRPFRFHHLPPRSSRNE